MKVQAGKIKILGILTLDLLMRRFQENLSSILTKQIVPQAVEIKRSCPVAQVARKGVGGARREKKAY